MATLKCSRCSATFGPYPPRHRCSKCGGPLEYVYDLRRLRGAKFTRLRGIWRYASLLPQTEHRVTLGEGGTPLHKAARLTDRLKLKEVYLKDETRNPTNSFRDRSAALMVSNAIDLGYSHVVCASNGNMGASIAAYCAKSGLTAHVIVPRNVDVGKLVQMVMYNARIEEYGDTVDESIVRAERLVEETGWYQATPELNPLTIEAQKTISYEVAEEVGDVGWFIVPVGSGGTLYSIWKGMREAVELGMLESAPKMVGVQARGCSPIVDAHVEGVLKPTPRPATMALGILVRNPLNAELAIRAVKESGGVMVEVSDREILRAEHELARLEGVFAEPASSATIAGLKKLVRRGTISVDDRVVCLITGGGLKAADVVRLIEKRRRAPILGLKLTTKEKILRILAEADSYGYEIWKRLGRIVERAAVYQHLNELVDRGLVSTYETGGKRYFKITERGLRFLRAVDELRSLVG